MMIINYVNDSWQMNEIRVASNDGKYQSTVTIVIVMTE